MVYWLSSWFAKQAVQVLIPGLATTISEIGFVLLPSHDIAEKLLKRRKSSKQPTNLSLNKNKEIYFYYMY